VDLSRQLRRTLADLRDKRRLEAFLDGRTSVSDDLLFPSKTGGVLDPANLIHYYFAPSVEAAGLRHIRFHDLRHTFGSLLIQQGASLTYVKEQMGHSSIEVTVDTYGHLIPGADIAWVDRLDTPTTPQPSATPAQPASNEGSEESAELIEKISEPGRTRTCNPLMTPELLCSWLFKHFLASSITVYWGLRQGSVPRLVPSLLDEGHYHCSRLFGLMSSPTILFVIAEPTRSSPLPPATPTLHLFRQPS
jgi:hypothetical protein